MTQGFSGGFFLPAQRSVHCKGGFFSSATRAAVPTATAASATAASGSSKPSTASFPVLSTLPHVPPPEDAAKTVHLKQRARRVYDPHEGEEDAGGSMEDEIKRQLEAAIEVRVERSTPIASRGVRSRHQQQPKKQANTTSRAPNSCSNHAHHDMLERSRQQAAREPPQATTAGDKGDDINIKFEIAMKELNQIKDEFDLKQQRQQSAPTLLAAPPVSATIQPATPQAAKSLLLKVTTSTNQTPEPSTTTNDTPQTQRNMQSPRQRLQIAEMVMRKLYKKSVQTEQELAVVKAEKEQLAKQIADLEATRDQPARPTQTPRDLPNAQSSSPHACPRCAMASAVGFVLANPPSMETISRIDQQQLEYLRHLAAEQDRTITSLKMRIEELSAQLTAARQQPHGKPAGSGKTTTPRHAVTKLQGKLKDALHESERQKTNYLKLKRDFQHLLALKTKSLYENPTQVNASAKELVALMDKQLKQLELEHSMNLSLYNSKLYETEQQSCESYAQQRLLEEEMERVARDVQQRDALDVEIEQCMANVFERLHHVESENLHLKNTMRSAHIT